MGLLLVLFLLLEQLPVDDDDRLRRFNFLIKTSKRRKKNVNEKICLCNIYFEHGVIQEYLVQVFVDYLVLSLIHFVDQLEIND
jgi:hypothetical protein